VQQVVRENETGYLPPLKTKIERMEQYEFVFVGFPTWGMKLPPPVKSFLHQYNLKGKTVIPFNTNGGYGVGSSFDTIRELCPQSTILQGFTTRADRRSMDTTSILKMPGQKKPAEKLKIG
jgi:flavodoxin-like protein